MPFQPVNYANIEPQGNPFMRDFVDNLTKGYKAGRLPYETQQAEEKQQLANAMSKMQNQEEPQKFSSDMKGAALKQAFQSMLNNEQPEKFKSDMQTDALSRALSQAKIGELNRNASLPFGGKIAPGSVGQAMWLDMIGKKYGANSPEYNSAKQAYDSDLDKAKVLNSYRQELTNTTDKRVSTPQAREYQEMDDISNGYMPGTGRKVPIPPEKQQEMADQYALKMQKQNTDAQTRAKTLYASNIDKTIKNINPIHLTQYGGLTGEGKLKADMLSSALGKAPSRYQDYQKALTNAVLLSKQVRQFYGDSIQPSVQEKLGQLTNPATWKTDPKLALSNYNAFIKTLKNETDTYRNALKSTKEYQGNDDGNNQPDLSSLSTEELLKMHSGAK